MKMLLRSTIMAFVLTVMLAACGGGGGDGGGGGGEGLTAPATNISGTWNTTETMGTNTCGNTVGSQEFSTATITHTTGSNSFMITTGGQSYTGTISGTHLSYSGTASNTDCPLGFNIAVSLDLQAPNYTTATGSVVWTCQYTGGSCNGTTNLSTTCTTCGGGGDTTSPSTPTGLDAAAGSSSQINLVWTASTDNVGVAGYKIYRDGAYLKSVTTAVTIDTGLNANAQYCYKVSAYDAANNESAQSTQACATTQSGGGGASWTGTKQLGTAQADSGMGVAVDSSGNVYVTGYTGGSLDGNTSTGNGDIFLVKYNSAGTKQWLRQLGTTSGDSGYAVAVDAGGNVYVTGDTGGSLDGNTSTGNGDIFLVKYNAAGTKQWTRQLGTTSYDVGYGVAVDTGGNVYVTGYTNGGLDGNTSTGSSDMFLVKYNAGGTKQWTRQLGTTSNDYGYGVAVDTSGNVYVTGFTGGGLDGNTSAGNSDIFLVKYNSSGTKQWTHQLGTSATDSGYGVDVNAGGDVFVTGTTGGGLDGNTSAGSTDMFLVKYNSSGVKQ